MIVQLLAGMLIGCIVASITWGIIVKSNKNRADGLKRERDDVMRSIGEIMVQIDALVNAGQKSSAGTLSLRQSLKMKIEEVNRLLKPNMHKLEVFYVKYIEGQIDSYRQAVAGGTSKVIGTTTETVLPAESRKPDRTTRSPIDTSTVSEPVPSIGNVESVAPATSTSDAISREEHRLRTAVTDTHSAIPAAAPEDEAKVPKAPETDLFEMSVADDESRPNAAVGSLPSQAVSEPMPQNPAPEAAVELETINRREEEFSLETIMESRTDVLNPPVSKQPAVRKPQEPVARPTEKVPPPPPKTAAISAPPAAPVPATGKAPAADPFDNEEFSMETLIDVDINTISPYLKKEASAKSPFPLKPAESESFKVSSQKPAEPQETVTLEVVIDSRASHHNVVPADADAIPGAKTSEKATDHIPEETKLTRGVDLAAISGKNTPAVESDEAVFELEVVSPPPVAPSKDAAAVTSHVSVEDIEAFDKEEAMITGDDIFDKIAALETASPAEPVKPPVNKEPIKKSTPLAPVAPPKPSPAKPAPASMAVKKDTVMPGPKSATRDDAITGDDVADKIDSFFGLFDK